MQYLLSIYQPDGDPPPPEVLGPIMTQPAARGARNCRRRARGSSPPACSPASTRHRRPRHQDGEALMTDGPFTEGKEHLGGFTVIAAPISTPRWLGRQTRRRHGPAGRGAAVPGRRRKADADGSPAVEPRTSSASSAAEYGRAVAVLTRLFGDIDLAEEAVQDAFTAARAALAGRPGCRPARPAGSSPPPATGPSTGCAGRRPATTGHAQAAAAADQPGSSASEPPRTRPRRDPCATTGCG